MVSNPDVGEFTAGAGNFLDRAVLRPSQREVRGLDVHGSGEFGAGREGGKKHKGIDFKYKSGELVYPEFPGFVCNIGFPYDPQNKTLGHFRYIAIKDCYGNVAHYFYIRPLITFHARPYIFPGMPIGTVQSLQDAYPGITDHVHFEVKRDGTHINPERYLVAPWEAWEVNGKD